MEKLQRLKNAFDKIRDAVRKAKQPVIVDVCEDPYVSFGLIMQLNPYIMFGLKERSLTRKVETAPSKQYTDLLDMCGELSNRKGISNEDIANVQCFLQSIESDELKKFASEYITKTITLGVTSKTLNKAFGKEILPQLGCMLANKYFDHQNAIDGKKFAVTEKLDGVRCIAMLQRGREPMLYTRQGQVIEGLVDIEAELLELTKNHSFNTLMLDGELLIDNRDEFESKEQYKRTTQIVRKNGEKHGITYHVFDMVRNGNCMIPYASRRDILSYYVSHMAQQHVRLLPVLYAGDNQYMIIRLLDDQRELGHEGVMINVLYAPYEYKRTNNLLKCKVMQDADLEIVGFQEGSGKFKGTLGALLVNYKGSAVGVGSGLSEEDRSEIWNNQKKYLGRIATVQYFEETHDAHGNVSLRFPVFREIREEGKEVSYN